MMYTRTTDNIESSKFKQIILLHTALPDYRQPVLDALVERLGDRLLVLSGTVYFDATIVTRASLPGNLVSVKNYFIFGRRLLWQGGVIGRAVSASVAIVEFNPRILSSWVILLSRRLLGRETALWGHVFSRKGPASPTNLIRRLMLRLADAFIAYTATEAAVFSQWVRNMPVISANNALYSRTLQGPAIGPRIPVDIICVGRLVQAKKPDLLLSGFLIAKDKLDPATRLIFAGDGPLRNALQMEAERHQVQDRVRFIGHMNHPNGLRALYEGALVSVSPGYAGLSLIQSLWFGVPMIIARDEPHAPEIEAAKENENCLFFASDDAQDLARALQSVFEHRDAWLAKRPSLSHWCAERYSTEIMADRIVGLADRLSSQG